MNGRDSQPPNSPTEERVIPLVKQSPGDVIRTVGRSGWKYTDELYNRRWLARIRSKSVTDANGCFLWQGAVQGKGYGSTTYRGNTITTHRQVYRLLVRADLATQDYVCHSCDARRCWNPDHLWVGAPADNSLDMVKKGRCHEWSVTQCPRGHDYNEENTYIHRAKSGRVARQCKLCQRIQGRMKSGWPEHLAVALPKVPAGYTRESFK